MAFPPKPLMRLWRQKAEPAPKAARPSIDAAAVDIASRGATIHHGICWEQDWRQVERDLRRSGCCWWAFPVLSDKGRITARVVLADRPLDHLEDAGSHKPGNAAEAAGYIAAYCVAAVESQTFACPKWSE